MPSSSSDCASSHAPPFSQAKTLPILSTSLFADESTPKNPVLYNQSLVFLPPSNILNEAALADEGLPLLTGSYAWSLACGTWAVSLRYDLIEQHEFMNNLDRSSPRTCNTLLGSLNPETFPRTFH